MKKQDNMRVFAAELSKLVGKHIGLDHIHPGKGHYYYIQPTKIGSPMLLNHYRGPIFVDIHPDDLEGLQSGDIDAMEYIHTANWQIGYYWGGGSMVGGGFYQPFDIVGRSEEVKRYFKILSCRTQKRSSGYMPSEDVCAKCPVNDCPFSEYKEGKWENEVREEDPRVIFFEALNRRFKTEYDGCTLRGFLSGFRIGGIPKNEIYIRSNSYCENEPYSFCAFAPADTVRALLMHEIEPEDWNEYVLKFKFKHAELNESSHNPVSMEQIHRIFSKHDNEKNGVRETVELSAEQPVEKDRLWKKIRNFINFEK